MKIHSDCFKFSIAAIPNYVGIGCFKDRLKVRAMTLLANYRDPADNSVDWNDLETSVVKRCALEVRDICLKAFFVNVNAIFCAISIKANASLLHFSRKRNVKQ